MPVFAGFAPAVSGDGGGGGGGLTPTQMAQLSDAVETTQEFSRQSPLSLLLVQQHIATEYSTEAGFQSAYTAAGLTGTDAVAGVIGGQPILRAGQTAVIEQPSDIVIGKTIFVVADRNFRRWDGSSWVLISMGGGGDVVNVADMTDTDSATNVRYFGWVDGSASGGWLIRRIDGSGPAVADATGNAGVADLAAAWPQRSTLVYSGA